LTIAYRWLASFGDARENGEQQARQRCAPLDGGSNDNDNEEAEGTGTWEEGGHSVESVY